MIDITMKIDKDNKVWEWLKSQKNKLINMGHIGTHIDIYEKSEIPIEYFKCKCKIIDCCKYSLDDEIGIESLKDLEIEERDFVIFKTDIQNNNEYGSDIYIKNHHQISYELINYLLEKKVAFIGIDAAGIRRGSEHIEVDIKAEKNKTFIIENLDLSQVELVDNDFIVYTMWIENPFSTGLSARVLLDLK